MSHDHVDRDHAPATRTLDEVIDRGSVVMVLTAMDLEGGPHAGGDTHLSLLNTLCGTPLTCGSVNGSVSRFLVNRAKDGVAKVEGRESGTPAVMVFADPGASDYLFAKGRVTARSSRPEVDELWSVGAAAAFDGPDDPDIGVLEFRAESGRWWSGPASTLDRTLGVVTSAVLNRPYDATDNGPIQG